MRKLLWMILFFAAYVWMMTSGHEGIVIDYGKAAYNGLISWFDDAEVDFQMKKNQKIKKRSRRWN